MTRFLMKECNLSPVNQMTNQNKFRSVALHKALQNGDIAIINELLLDSRTQIVFDPAMSDLVYHPLSRATAKLRVINIEQKSAEKRVSNSEATYLDIIEMFLKNGAQYDRFICTSLHPASGIRYCHYA